MTSVHNYVSARLCRIFDARVQWSLGRGSNSKSTVKRESLKRGPSDTTETVRGPKIYRALLSRADSIVSRAEEARQQELEEEGNDPPAWTLVTVSWISASRAEISASRRADCVLQQL
jgi:hypothetical protein